MNQAVVFEGLERLAKETIGGGFVAEPERVGLLGLTTGGDLESGNGLEDSGDEEAFEGVAWVEGVPELEEFVEYGLVEVGG